VDQVVRAHHWSFAVDLASHPPLPLTQFNLCPPHPSCASPRSSSWSVAGSHRSARPGCRLSIDRQILARRAAATTVGLRKDNLRRDHSQAERIDLLVRIVAYLDHSGDGVSDFLISRQDLFSFCRWGFDLSELAGSSNLACL